jgi:pyridoxamine 5'-phosphate oxidase
MSQIVPLAEPYDRFAELFAAAKAVGPGRLPEPTAFALATVDADGTPSVRMLLLKAYDHHGFVFYTNFESRKGRALLATRRAAMCFHWQPLEVQVRVEGAVVQVTDAEADVYFASRPRGSQIGAWASEQSRPMADPGDLAARVAQFERRYEGRSVPRPPWWSGVRLEPRVIEHWKGMPSRLHVRDVYTREGDGWRVERWYP